jgi:hypothetical protein
VYAAVALGIVISLVLMSLFMWRWMRNAFASTPRGVLRHLRKAGGVHRMKLRGWEGTWNPAKPLGIDNRIFGPGEATHSLDEQGAVHLELRGRGNKLALYSGPIPETLIRPSQAAQRGRKLMRYVLIGYAALMIIGFVVGYFAAGGSAVHRLVAGVIGVFVAMVLAWFVALVFRVGTSVGSLARGKRDS